MISIGVDTHSRLSVAVALDAAGGEVGRWHGANDTAGWAAVLAWAQALAAERQWGIEGSGGHGRGLAQALAVAGEAVHEVNPRWTAAERRGARARGTSDVLDARAIAAVVRRDGPRLPRLAADAATAVCSTGSRVSGRRRRRMPCACTINSTPTCATSTPAMPPAAQPDHRGWGAGRDRLSDRPRQRPGPAASRGRAAARRTPVGHPRPDRRPDHAA